MYAVLYYLAIAIHYLGTAILLFWIVKIKLRLSFFWLLSIWFVLWLGAGLLCGGCPYTYVEEYFAHKRWGTERTYDFSKSLLYQVVFKHIYSRP